MKFRTLRAGTAPIKGWSPSASLAVSSDASRDIPFASVYWIDFHYAMQIVVEEKGRAHLDEEIDKGLHEMAEMMFSEVKEKMKAARREIMIGDRMEAFRLLDEAISACRFTREK